jgi:hypothetical protein
VGGGRHRIRSHWWLNGTHSIARYKRLCFRVESVAVVTPRDRMLTLWIMRICVGWELSIGVGDDHRPGGISWRLGLRSAVLIRDR